MRLLKQYFFAGVKSLLGSYPLPLVTLSHLFGQAPNPRRVTYFFNGPLYSLTCDIMYDVISWIFLTFETFQKYSPMMSSMKCLFAFEFHGAQYMRELSKIYKYLKILLFFIDP